MHNCRAAQILAYWNYYAQRKKEKKKKKTKDIFKNSEVIYESGEF